MHQLISSDFSNLLEFKLTIFPVRNILYKRYLCFLSFVDMDGINHDEQFHSAAFCNRECSSNSALHGSSLEPVHAPSSCVSTVLEHRAGNGFYRYPGLCVDDYCRTYEHCWHYIFSPLLHPGRSLDASLAW